MQQLIKQTLNKLFKGGNMYGYITGITETDDISFCPKCGELIKAFYGDGTVKCECGYHFGVVECEDD